ncbi:MAG: HAD-IC family P-type ATPase [Candidatus Kaiserbacteria bacterium]|nr:MAG: HAD-IC family P-type ATPase [Candidatus Kaiserbacteria bacterium]
MPIGLELLKRPFAALAPEEVADLLASDVHAGLPEAEARRRLSVFGANVFEKRKRSGLFFILLQQFRSPLILILAFAAVLTLLIGHVRDSLFIFAAVIVNASLGFYQEYKAEQALSELKTYLRDRARVLRAEGEHEIDASLLVPGDIIRISQGDRIPADARLVFVNDLQVDEALLTGESLPIVKGVEAVPTDAGVADQLSMVFAGTLVTQGLGTAIVCRTDSATELGRIAELVGAAEAEDTPLQAAIQRFSARAGFFLGGLAILVFGVGIWAGYSVFDMFVTSVAVAVAAVPEGLPVALTVILAIGVQRMAKRRGVIRKLVAAEALGDTTVILTDKTGTLTMAKMELDKLLPEGVEKGVLLEYALLNSNVLVENPDDPPAEWRMSGKLLEVALVRAGAMRDISVEEVRRRLPVRASLPFNAVNKFSVSLTEEGGKRKLVFFGAAEILVGHSQLDEPKRRELLARIDALATAGEFVVAVATKEIDAKDAQHFPKALPSEHLHFKGLITLRDPIRLGVQEAIRRVERAGIRTVIMTGDHRGTAEAIAREVGLPTPPGSVLDASELRTLSPQQLAARLGGLRVISRVSPLDKMLLTKALQSAGEVVAMTGDGVNDAPSIKQADVGVAMGSGTEVARDVADLVILDDNFETIVAAVEEGRQIRKNISKVLVYMLSSVFDELLLIGGSIVLGLALPLSALQILYVNFFSDSFPAIAFAFEKDELSGAPTRRGALFDPLMKFLIIFIGFSSTALLLLLYWLLSRTALSPEIVQTFIFASFGSYTLFLAFSLRSLERSIFEYGLFGNKYLLSGVGAGLLLMLAALYVPFLQEILGTVPLPLPWGAAVVAVGLLNIAAIEAGKLIFRTRESRRTLQLASARAAMPIR